MCWPLLKGLQQFSGRLESCGANCSVKFKVGKICFQSVTTPPKDDCYIKLHPNKTPAGEF